MSGQDGDTVSPGEIGHFTYCPRSWALIALEQHWSDNVHTALGEVAHARVDEGDGSANTLLHVTVWSDTVGLLGVADRVDLTGTGPMPVEYKSAPRLRADHRAQLVAQAVCLEEMYGTPVTVGLVWLTKTRRRVSVGITEADKEHVREVAGAVRRARDTPAMPNPVNDRRCAECSLNARCLPSVVADRRRISNLHSSLFLAPP